MNFEHLLELTWVFGYPLALTLIVVICGSLYAVSKGLDGCSLEKCFPFFEDVREEANHPFIHSAA